MDKRMTHSQQVHKKRSLRISAIMICAAFFCVFTAFDSLEGIQSSLNAEAGMGQVGLSVLYGWFIFSSFIIGPSSSKILGPKWAICVGMLPYVIYTVINLSRGIH